MAAATATAASPNQAYLRCWARLVRSATASGVRLGTVGSEQFEQVDDVRAEQLRRVGRHPAGEILIPDDRHTVAGDDLLPRHGQFTIAAAGRGQVDNDA